MRPATSPVEASNVIPGGNVLALASGLLDLSTNCVTPCCKLFFKTSNISENSLLSSFISNRIVNKTKKSSEDFISLIIILIRELWHNENYNLLNKIIIFTNNQNNEEVYPLTIAEIDDTQRADSKWKPFFKRGSRGQNLKSDYQQG